MHGKSQADAWQKYIREHMSSAMSRGSAWFLFGLSFLVVYREVFETILFYAALWEQGDTQAIVAGAAVAISALAVIAIAMLRFSRRLPITQFFSYSSVLIAVLAVVLTGKGVAALQEAGLIAIRPLQAVPRIDLLGLFPSLQAIVAQAVMVVLLVIGFLWIRRPTAN
jgi:high-affinity iron transporter